MMTRSSAAVAMLAAGLVLTTGCGSPTNIASASPTANTIVSQPACGTAANPCLAVVTRHSGDFVVVDVSAANGLRTVTSLGPVSWPVFINATEVSFLTGGGLVRESISGGQRTAVLKADDLMAYAWSPDGKTLAYLVPSGSGMALHLNAAGKDEVVDGSLPARPGVGCQTQFCAVADSWDFHLRYSPDGKYISFVDSIANVRSFRLWTANGALVESSDSSGHGMSTWASGGFYFADPQGVEVWRAGSVSMFLPGVSWIRPVASANGHDIVYATRDAQGLHHTFVADTATAKTHEISQGRVAPQFLSPGTVWFAGERPCATADNCPAGYQIVRGGDEYVFDLALGTETQTDIDFIGDVWPHAA